MNLSLIEKINKIKLVITDVDGILTTGQLYYTAQGESIKVFHVRDGHGIKQLQRAGVPVAIISGRQSPALSYRAKELGICHVFQGIDNKLPCYLSLLKQLDLQDQAVAYLGDDEPDLPILTRVGLSITVQDAHPTIKEKVHYITQACGGFGAFREVSDMILAQQYLSAITHNGALSSEN